MIIDGEKWACEACVRGHRVSNCQHSDRPLQHINKKGRPVSQCQHCRSMRKSRASHVKCDCGEKSHKCAHLKTTVEGHRDSCCCNHGGRCTCSHKKEPQLDPVPESDSDDHDTTLSASASCGGAAKPACAAKAGVVKAGAVRSRRRANTIHPDGGALTFDEHGRHKPTYKHAKASSKCEPYPLKRVNSVHSTSSLPNRSPADSPAAAAYNAAADPSSGLDSAATAARRAVKSETASPLLAGGYPQLTGQLPPLDLSGIEYPRYVAGTGSSGFDLFGTGGLPDHEGPMFSAGLTAPPVDWSHYDGLDFGRSGDAFTPSSFSHNHGYGSGTGFDFSGSEQAPTMTTATSGDVSEVEDFMGPGGADEFDVAGAFSAGYGLAPDLSTLEYEDFGAVAKVQGALAATGSGTKLYGAAAGAEDPSLVAPAGAAFADDPLFWMNDYTNPMPVLDNSAADPNALYNWETR